MPRYLFIKPSSLGDIVHALIVAQALKSQRPEAEIHWVVREGFEPLLNSTAIVDRILLFKRRGGLREFLRLLREIRATPYDATLDLQALLRTGLMAFAARAPLKLCRRDQREGAQLFANRIVPLPVSGHHAVDKLMEFLPPLGLQKIYSPLQLKTSPSAPPASTSSHPVRVPEFSPPESSAAQPLSTPFADAKGSMGAGGPMPHPHLSPHTLLLFPSSRGKWANKEWPHFATLTQRLLALGHPVAWASDVPLSVPPGALDFCAGKVSLGGLLPFIAQARLVIGNDAGPTHMAAALGRPTIGLYGPTLPELAGAYPLNSPTNRNLRAPSGKMEDLRVEEVLATATSLLS